MFSAQIEKRWSHQMSTWENKKWRENDRVGNVAKFIFKFNCSIEICSVIVHDFHTKFSGRGVNLRLFHELPVIYISFIKPDCFNPKSFRYKVCYRIYSVFCYFGFCYLHFQTFSVWVAKSSNEHFRKLDKILRHFCGWHFFVFVTVYEIFGF